MQPQKDMTQPSTHHCECLCPTSVREEDDEEKERKELDKAEGVGEAGDWASFLFSVAVKWRSNCGRAAGEQIGFLKPASISAIHGAQGCHTQSVCSTCKQTDCKLAYNFVLTMSFLQLSAFRLPCLLYSNMKLSGPLPELSSALKSHPFPSKLSYLKFIGGQSVGWMLCCFHGGKKSSVDFRGLGSQIYSLEVHISFSWLLLIAQRQEI